MRRLPARRTKKRLKSKTIPAPRNGLVTNHNPARPVKDSAEVMDNWFPTTRGVRVRGGLQKSATIGTTVVSTFSYNDGVTPKLFATSGTAVYDVSALDPDNVPTPDITGQTSGYYSTAHMGATGSEYLYAVNGTDSAQLYDGGSWTAVTGASSPAITGVTTSDLSAVWKYANRLFFVEKGTKTAWYLPVDSVGGAAQSVSMAGVFQKGGNLLTGATWSLDAGDGLDDKCVFISDAGEVAVYQGTDPSGGNWDKVGRYDIPKPLGVNSTMQAGGDLLIGTVDGVIPLSQIIQKDPAALSLSAVSNPIEPLWNFEARRATSPVEMVKWDDRGLGVFTFPEASRVLVVNLQTGGWGVAEGWTGQSAAVFGSKCYMGTSDGTIYAVDETGMDGTAPFTAKLCHSFFGDGEYMEASQIQHVFYAPGAFNFKSSIATDFNARDFPTAPGDSGLANSANYMIWDSSNWDEAVWWSVDFLENTQPVSTRWVGVSGAGQSLAPQIQITSGESVKLEIELIRSIVAYLPGALVT